jgi:List-Bact-rpt repeat protein
MPLGSPVDKSANSRAADAAYDKAFAAFQEKSFEVARRWVLEALAHNRQHANARALLARLDAARRPASPFESSSSGSEVISTDPTVLISRASQPVAAEPIEPTVMAGRTDARRRPPDTDTNVSIPVPPRASARPVADPTVIGQPRPRAAATRQKSSFSLGAALTSLGERLQGRGRPAPVAGRPRTAGSWFETPAARGALVALAAVAVGVFLVWGLYRTVRWFFPAGQELTIAKPQNGTIVGPGIECGTGGDKCTTHRPTDETVELIAKPDKDYVWTGFTGDCAPMGRTSMTKARNCGATFDHVAATAAAVTFRLTITKPEGGTIVGAGGILCGVNGSTCTIDVPSGAPVTLRAEAADGYVWEQFTGDCPSTGETIMTSAKSCGATFAKTATPAVNVPPRPLPPATPRPRPAPAQPQSTVATPSAPGPATAPGGGTQTPTPTSPTPTPTDPGKPAPPPITREDHAKQEIQQLVKNYCAALQSLKSSAVQDLFQPKVERDYKERFKEYKSLKCTLGSDPLEFIALDAREEAGVARLKFPMKQTIEMRSGGAPKTSETMVTMLVSRKGYQTPWRINELTAEEKPKS